MCAFGCVYGRKGGHGCVVDGKNGVGNVNDIDYMTGCRFWLNLLTRCAVVVLSLTEQVSNNTKLI